MVFSDPVLGTVQNKALSGVYEVQILYIFFCILFLMNLLTAASLGPQAGFISMLVRKDSKVSLEVTGVLLRQVVLMWTECLSAVVCSDFLIFYKWGVTMHSTNQFPVVVKLKEN